METETVTLKCSICGEVLPPIGEGYEPIPEADLDRLVCDDCHWAEVRREADDDDEI